jgi:cation:H+ antiporter
MHRHEILLTVVQSLLGLMLLADLTFTWWEATVVFVLWFVQFVVPGIRVEVIYAYLVLMGVVLVEMLLGRRRLVAFPAFLRHLKGVPASSPAA